jgi:hypothetical protein
MDVDKQTIEFDQLGTRNALLTGEAERGVERRNIGWLEQHCYATGIKPCVGGSGHLK